MDKIKREHLIFGVGGLTLGAGLVTAINMTKIGVIISIMFLIIMAILMELDSRDEFRSLTQG